MQHLPFENDPGAAWYEYMAGKDEGSSFLKNGSFYDIDQGAAPELPLQFPESFYDRAARTDTINSIM